MGLFSSHKDDRQEITSDGNPTPVSGGQNPSPTQNGGMPPISITVNTGGDNQGKKQSGWEIVTKVILAALAVSAIALSVYSIYAAIHDKAYSQEQGDSYLCLTGKSYSESKTIYDSFGTADRTITNQLTIKDYAFVGDQLFFSQSKISPSLLTAANTAKIIGTGYTDIALYDLTDDVALMATSRTDFANGRFAIDCSSLTEGDYLLYPLSALTTGSGKSAIYPFSINTDESIRKTVYTLPDKDGKRKRITIKDNAVSPYTLLTVKEAGSVLPDNVYDAVLLNQQFVNNANIGASDTMAVTEMTRIADAINLQSIYAIKVVDSISTANSVNANASIVLSTATANSLSVYNPKTITGFTTSLLGSTSSLSGYDAVPEVRELTGYLDCAGIGYFDVIGNGVLPPVTSRVGKQSYLVEKTADNSYLETIKSILLRI